MEKNIEQERKEKIQKEKEFLQELEKIRMKGIKRFIQNKEKTYINKNKFEKKNNIRDKNDQKRGGSYRKRFLSSDPIGENEYYTKRNKDINYSRNKIGLSYKNNTTEEKSDRYGYIKKNKDYFFHDL